MLDLKAKYEILSFSVGDTKAGTKMGKMQIKNLETKVILNCVLWEETLNRTPDIALRPGNIIRIITGNYNDKFNNCLINNLEVLEEASLGLDEEEREFYYSKIIQEVEAFHNEKLKNFVMNILKANEQKFKVCPAAKLMHHNFIGGLVIHTYECVEFAKAIFPKIVKHIDYEEVIAASILHDIGKVFEYEINLESGLIDYNETFRKDWISHSQYGFSICMNEGFLNIAKMIAAHHGRSDWGAMIDLGEKDLEPFYYIIHHVDDLSAKFGATSINDIKKTQKKAFNNENI